MNCITFCLAYDWSSTFICISVLHLFFLNQVGDCGSHNDKPIGSCCPGGKDHGVEGGHQLNSSIETCPISVAPPSGM